MTMQQAALQFDLNAELSFSSFYTACNKQAINHLSDMASGKGEMQFYLWGGNGAGKSHLLQACCQYAYQQKHQAFYLSLQKNQLIDPQILKGLEHFDLICIDNLDYCAQNAAWELALFNLYNDLRQNNHKLILSSHCSPKKLPVNLMDLKSRINWGLSLKLQPLSDEERIAAFTHKAKYLGFEISTKVGDFLTKHYAYDLPTLWTLLSALEQETLIAKRKLTLPFLKQILAKQHLPTSP